MGQGEELAQPAELTAAVEGDVLPTLSAGDHGADGDHQDIDQPVLDLARAAGIIQFREMLAQLSDQDDGLFTRSKEAAYLNALNPVPPPYHFMR